MITLYLNKKWSGRQSILKECHLLGGHDTEADIRKYLLKLREQGYLLIKEGRGGSILSEMGYNNLS